MWKKRAEQSPEGEGREVCQPGVSSLVQHLTNSGPRISKTPAPKEQTENCQVCNCSQFWRHFAEAKCTYSLIACIPTSAFNTCIRSGDGEFCSCFKCEQTEMLLACRALQVYEDYGVPMSRIHQAQHRSGNTPGLSGALRFPHCCVFWLQSEQKGTAHFSHLLSFRVDITQTLPRTDRIMRLCIGSHVQFLFGSFCVLSCLLRFLWQAFMKKLVHSF